MIEITGKLRLSAAAFGRKSQPITDGQIGNDVLWLGWIGLDLFAQILDERAERMDAFGRIGGPKLPDDFHRSYGLIRVGPQLAKNTVFETSEPDLPKAAPDHAGTEDYCLIADLDRFE